MTSLELDLVRTLSPDHGHEKAVRMVRAFSRSVGRRGMRRLMELRSLRDIERYLAEEVCRG